LLALIFVFSCPRLHAVNWLPFGPDGGDARSFAADPQDSSHLYLGTATGWMYESRNGGTDWKRLAWVGKRDDLVLDSIVVDEANPKHIVVGAWVLGSPDGGIYVSNDSGVSWVNEMEMRGQSIRALAAAPSNPQVLVAGTLKGVYRSEDGGSHWKLISPPGSKELHQVESIAVDPVDPKIIYAGTWHLPWKTIDGGGGWVNIKQGVIDDSDVFSIIVDPKDPKVVYASACSGIYKSMDSGAKFQKIQGIPSTARRTRVLMQDPKNLNIIFAGTTEGLFRSGDSGKTWLRTTGPEVIVNDVYVDPADTNRVLLATDRGGVLASRDGGYSFVSSNKGFSARQITAYVADAERPARLYVGVVNDKEWGGVFVSENGGLSWTQKSAGLEGHDVVSLQQASDGTVVAGTRHGLFRLQGELWAPVTSVSLTVAAHGHAAAGKSTATSARLREKGDRFDGAVPAMARSGDTLYAATSEGLIESRTAGLTWKLTSGLPKHAWDYVAAARSMVVAATLRSAMMTTNGGVRWTSVKLPAALSHIGAVAVDGAGGLWVGGIEGVFVSENGGTTWQTLTDVHFGDVNSLFYDEASQRILITANNTNTIAFAIHLPDRKVSYWNSGWNLKLVRPVGDHLVAATLFDGMVVQPRMVDSADVHGH
jgi:photosystem II stability/assembly factor-like uncharacterized protein